MWGAFVAVIGHRLAAVHVIPYAIAKGAHPFLANSGVDLFFSGVILLALDGWVRNASCPSCASTWWSCK